MTHFSTNWRPYTTDLSLGHPFFSPMGLTASETSCPDGVSFSGKALVFSPSHLPPPTPSPTHINRASWCLQLPPRKQKNYGNCQTQRNIKVQDQPKVGPSGTGQIWPLSKALLKSKCGPHSEAPKDPSSLHTPGCSSVKRRSFQI